MTAPLSGQFSPEKAKGMFGGPRAPKGRDGAGNLNALSGTTYGGAGLGWYWQSYPNVISGLTEYATDATMPGSNIEAVRATEVASESKVGGGPSQAEVPDYGGTAAY